MNNLVFFTICAKNYFGYARSWANNVRSIYGNLPVYVIIADDFSDHININTTDYNITSINEINIPNLNYMKFIYEVTEFSTAIKPFCINWLFNKHPGSTVVYMDSDTMLLSRFDEVESLINEGAEIVLTPHICEPLFDGKTPDEHTFILSGIYNLGFAAFNDKKTVRNFVRWWYEKLTEHCTWDLDKGIHVDQKWMDYAPAFLDEAKVLRHPGYNVAYWNLPHRDITNLNGQWMSNGLPLRFVHISGNSLTDPDNFSHHTNRFSRRDIGELDKLLSAYQASAIENGQLETRKWDYSYQKGLYFENIPFYLRRDFRMKFSAENMYGKDVEKYAWEYYNSTDDNVPNYNNERLNRMAVAFYNTRADLKFAFDLKTKGGQENYLQWLQSEKIDLLRIPGDR